MAKGGKRLGAGRPKGSPNRNQALLRDYAQRAARGEGLDSPLDLMLETMRFFRAAAVECERSNSMLIVGSGTGVKKYSSIELRMLAVDAAAKAASYVHPKLASVDANMTARISVYEASLLALANELDG